MTQKQFSTNQTGPKLDNMLINRCLFAFGCLVIVLFVKISQGIAGMDIQKTCKTDELGTSVNCSHRHLLEIPKSTFKSATRDIDLSSNFIQKVHNFTFARLRQLEILDLSFNQIQHLEPLAFEGLRRLLSLNLTNNFLQLVPDTFSPSLFEPLKSLSTLRIQMYNTSNPYKYTWKGIDKCFSMLTNLQEFFFDIPNLFTFDNGFAKLTKLTTLSSVGQSGHWTPGRSWCALGSVKNNTFAAFANSNLRKFRLPHCAIGPVETGAFHPLRHLSILDISNNEALGLLKALHSLYGLQHQHMDEINFSKLNGEDAPPEDVMLYKSDLIYLKSICVQSIDFSQNFIAYIEKGSGELFGKPECLKMLKMSYHAMRFMPDFLYNILRYPSLKYIDVSGSVNSVTQASSIGYQSKDTSIYSTVRSLPGSPSASDQHTIPDKSFVMTINASNCFGSLDFGFGFLDNVTTNPIALNITNTISENVCGEHMPQIQGIIELDISGLRCSKFYEFLTFFPRLQKLTIRNTPNIYISLGDIDGIVDSFQNLSDLQELDLSGNKLTDLNKHLFTNNTKLRSINFSNNKLHRLPLAVNQIKHLSVLDLSANAITHLTAEEMSLIDQYLATQMDKSNFHINLGLNPLQCNCDTVDFINWIYMNERYVFQSGTYMCLLPNGSSIDLATFRSMMKNLSISCVSNTWLIIGVIGILFAILLCILSYVVYRYRTNLRYWFYTKLKPPIEMFAMKQFVYDAFVAYIEEDELWVYNDLCRVVENEEEPLKLCIHKRDFRPGKPIHENIIDKMRESKKIILVISADFLNSMYGPLEIEYAGMKSLEEGRDDLIICVLVEDVPVREMPKVLRNLWHRITFLKWTENPDEQQHFWNRLRNAITDAHE